VHISTGGEAGDLRFNDNTGSSISVSGSKGSRLSEKGLMLTEGKSLTGGRIIHRFGGLFLVRPSLLAREEAC